MPGVTVAGSNNVLAALRDDALTADEMLQAYCARVHARAGSYEAAARRLALNWRTVRTKVRAWTKRPGWMKHAGITSLARCIQVAADGVLGGPAAGSEHAGSMEFGDRLAIEIVANPWRDHRWLEE